MNVPNDASAAQRIGIHVAQSRRILAFLQKAASLREPGQRLCRAKLSRALYTLYLRLEKKQVLTRRAFEALPIMDLLGSRTLNTLASVEIGAYPGVMPHPGHRLWPLVGTRANLAGHRRLQRRLSGLALSQPRRAAIGERPARHHSPPITCALCRPAALRLSRRSAPIRPSRGPPQRQRKIHIE
jgi:hypothetical protein